MSTNTDPNANRKPSEPFRYKPGTLLEPGEALQMRMLMCGQKNLTQEETAAVLGCSRTHLELFWKANPDHRQAFDDGKQMRKVMLRAQGDIHAKLDPATWRFLAKNELGLSDDPSKAKLDEQATKNLKGMSREEANKRILELTPKLIGQERVSREAVIIEQKQGPFSEESNGGQEVHAAGKPLHHGAVEEGSGGRAAAPQAQGRSVPLGPQQEGGSKQGAGQALEKLQARLAELEASVVRKNPRKDGAPHTDRTKAATGQRTGQASVDAPTNTRQEMRPAHAPPRLPGRLGSR